MPRLKNPRYETFAQRQAAGATQLAAHIAAGFAGRSDGAACHMAHRPEIADRIRELKAGTLLSDAEDFSPLIDALGRMVKKAEEGGGAAALAAGRALVAEAARLIILQREQALADGSAFEELPPSLDSEAWLAEHGAKD